VVRRRLEGGKEDALEKRKEEENQRVRIPKASKGSEEEGVREMERKQEERSEEQSGEEEDKQALEELEVLEEEEEDVVKDKEKLGARLTKYPERWETIGCREMVEGGVKAEWIDGPPTQSADYTRREQYSGMMHQAMLQAIAEEVERGVLEVIDATEAKYVMAAFVVTKQEGKVRLILDCRPINIYIREQAFKMADWLELKRLLRRKMYAVTLDFSAAFHHLGVEEELRCLLNFRYAGVTYRYIGLPFGLRSAPRLFCAAMAATMNAVRARWPVVCSAYMDDVVILQAEKEVLRKTTEEIVEFVEWLGWTINREKSVMEPSQEYKYLGMNWSTSTMSVQMTAKKNTTLKKELKRWIKLAKGGAEVRVRDLARLIGQLSATRAQHEEASLYLAKLNRLKCTVVKQGGWEASAELTRAVIPELSWWLQTLRENVANSIQAFEPTATLCTDASETGWGGFCTVAGEEENWMYGWWKKGEVEVNCLRELNAVIRVVQRSLRGGLIQEGSDVLVKCDNTNVVYNVNRKRAGWRMRRRVKEFVAWLKKKRIRIECQHVPGEENNIADALSRLAKSGDYSLKEGVLMKAEATLGETAEVDLFANARNKQKEKYCTVEKDRNAVGRNAMNMSWTDGTVLLHPPIPMITRVLVKVQTDHARAILIVPAWRGQIWSPLLRTLTVKGPVVLGKCEELLEMGPGMKAKRAALPPGLLAASVLLGCEKTTRVRHCFGRC
jgi:hypothetical protein